MDIQAQAEAMFPLETEPTASLNAGWLRVDPQIIEKLDFIIQAVERIERRIDKVEQRLAEGRRVPAEV